MKALLAIAAIVIVSHLAIGTVSAASTTKSGVDRLDSMTNSIK